MCSFCKSSLSSNHYAKLWPDMHRLSVESAVGCLMSDDRGPIIIPVHSLGLVATCRIRYIVGNLAKIVKFYKNLANGQIAVKVGQCAGTMRGMRH